MSYQSLLDDVIAVEDDNKMAAEIHLEQRAEPEKRKRWIVREGEGEREGN